MERQENDYYPTPDSLAEAICLRIASVLVPYHCEVIEPSAGSGAFVKPLRNIWQLPELIAIDVNPDVKALNDAGADTVVKADWVEWVKTFKSEGPTLVVGNPPYSLAQEHILAGLDYLLPGSHICFLLKLDFLGGKEREKNLWRQGLLKYLIPIVGRPSFIKGSKSTTDTHEYGLFIWEVGFSGRTELLLPHIKWR